MVESLEFVDLELEDAAVYGYNFESNKKFPISLIRKRDLLFVN